MAAGSASSSDRLCFGPVRIGAVAAHDANRTHPVTVAHAGRHVLSHELAATTSAAVVVGLPRSPAAPSARSRGELQRADIIRTGCPCRLRGDQDRLYQLTPIEYETMMNPDVTLAASPKLVHARSPDLTASAQRRTPEPPDIAPHMNEGTP